MNSQFLVVRSSHFPRGCSKGVSGTLIASVRRYVRLKLSNWLLAIAALAVVAGSPMLPQIPEEDRRAIDQALGAKGTYLAANGVYKVVVPREAAAIVLDYRTLSPNLGLNSWAAFKPGIHHPATLTGQFLLLQDEVNPVIRSALKAGLEVTGLADLTVFDGPRLFTLDVTSAGTYRHLAAAFGQAYAEIKQVRRAKFEKQAVSSLPRLSLESRIDAKPLNDVLSMNGGVLDGVYRAAINRRAILNGEELSPEMGFMTSISISGTPEQALAIGEIAATSEEIQPVLRGLLTKNIRIASVRNHTIGEHPRYLFVRLRGRGSAVDRAKSLRYALDTQIGAVSEPNSADL